VQNWHRSHARCAQAKLRLRVAILSKELKDFCCRSAYDRRLHHLVVIEELPQEVCARVPSWGIWSLEEAQEEASLRICQRVCVGKRLLKSCKKRHKSASRWWVSWRDTSYSRLHKEEGGREVYSSGGRSSKSERARVSIEIPRSVTLFVDRVYRCFAWEWLEGCPWRSRDREARSSEEFRRLRGPQEWWRGRW